MATTAELEARIKKLEGIVTALTSGTQLKMPLDVVTQALIREHLPVYNGVQVAGSVSVGSYIEVMIDGIKYQVLCK